MTQRIALITGSTRGIGLAIAEALSGAGYRVLVTGRRAEEASTVAERLGGLGFGADLSDRGAIVKLLDDIAARAGRVDVLVNNAGIAESAPYSRTTDEIWDRTMMVNATAPFLLCRALVPAMVRAGYGRVINVASNAGRVGYAYTTAYCASKHALIGLTRALAAELARTDVTVNALCPGWVRTDMAAEAASRIADKTKRSADEAEQALAAMSPQNRLIEAEEVAHAVLALLPEAARGIHGQAWVIDGGQVQA